MRRIDFEYLLLNTFDSLIENDFFVSQEILNGKTMTRAARIVNHAYI
jgi:hypothetical protein